MEWKPAQQHGHHGVSQQQSQEPRENLLAQEERIRLNSNKRRNALTVCSLREDILSPLGVLYSRNQREWRRDAETDRAD